MALSSVTLQSGLGRAALGGLGAGLLVGAAYLAARALLALRFECPGDLALAECTLAEQTAREVGRYQALVSLALALLGTASFLYLRARRKASS